MRKYKIFHDSKLERLGDYVNLMLADGWELQGGIAVEGYSGWGVGPKYLQAMTKETAIKTAIDKS